MLGFLFVILILLDFIISTVLDSHEALMSSSRINETRS